MKGNELLKVIAKSRRSRFENFVASHILAIVLVATMLTLTSAGVIAAAVWQSTNMTGGGTITVSPTPTGGGGGGGTTANYDYTIDTTTIALGNATVVPGGAVSLSATATVTNTRDQPLNGFDLTNITYPVGPNVMTTLISPSLTVSGGPISPGASGAVTFNFTATAPAQSTSIDLTKLKCVLTPN